MADPRLLLLSPADNVFVLRGAIEAGETIALEEGTAHVPGRLGLGHKVARGPIAAETPRVVSRDHQAIASLPAFYH